MTNSTGSMMAGNALEASTALQMTTCGALNTFSTVAGTYFDTLVVLICSPHHHRHSASQMMSKPTVQRAVNACQPHSYIH
jgi:hypothetical protein